MILMDDDYEKPVCFVIFYFFVMLRTLINASSDFKPNSYNLRVQIIIMLTSIFKITFAGHRGGVTGRNWIKNV